MSSSKFTITLADHKKDLEKSYDVTVDLGRNPWLTVLDVLEQVRGSMDPDLVHRHSCHHGSCGTCSCKINGADALACLTRLDDLHDDHIAIEPLAHYVHIGGSAVDPGPQFRGIPQGYSVLRPSEVNGDAETPEGIEAFARLESCIECGACVSACPEGAHFDGPFALAAVGREIEKSPERGHELLSRVSGRNGVDGCVRSYSCNRVCPTGVQPGLLINTLRDRLRSK